MTTAGLIAGVVGGLAAHGLVDFLRILRSAWKRPDIGPCGEIGHPDSAHFCRYPDGTPAAPAPRWRRR